MLVVAVLGRKGSGKTATIELIAKNLAEQGFKITAVKHVPEENFTLDTKGKDSWRFRQAGANPVVTVAHHELGIMKIVDTERLDLQKIIEQCVDEADVVLLEGFKKLLAKNPTIPKIVAIKTVKEAQEAHHNFQNIISFTSQVPISGELESLVYIHEDPSRLMNLIIALMR